LHGSEDNRGTKMREFRTSGTVRGVPGNRHSYREMLENE
jgi:hypothetical protein